MKELTDEDNYKIRITSGIDLIFELNRPLSREQLETIIADIAYNGRWDEEPLSSKTLKKEDVKA